MLSPEILGRTFADAPDPELARVAFSRVGDDPQGRALLARDDILPVAARLLGYSTAAADLLVRHPGEAAALADVSPRTRAQLDAELAADVRDVGLFEALRIFRRRAMMRVAARDLGDASLDEVVAEISHVAEACLEEVVREAAAGARLAVIGLGKLGGSELNYASDVDLLFVHEDVDAEEAERIVARLISLLSEPTAEGLALRVDPTLRPDGRSGALSMTLDATLDYYESRSATWERQAMIKARGVAGDPWLGSAFVEGVAPFVYPTQLAPAAIDEVRRTKVRLEEYIRQRGKELTEVKRGRGGIRDVEFAVQLLQIVHGRREPALREPNTLRALAALTQEGFVATDDADALTTAYRFLRTLEHRLQIVRDLQTHDLPADRHARTTLARSLAHGRCCRAAAHLRRHDRRGPNDPRALVLPALAGGVRRASRAATWRRPRGHRRVARRLGVRIGRPFLRGAATTRRSGDAHRQGAHQRVPGDGAPAGVVARPRRRPGPARTDRRSGGGAARARRPPGRRPCRRSPARRRRGRQLLLHRSARDRSGSTGGPERHPPPLHRRPSRSRRRRRARGDARAAPAPDGRCADGGRRASGCVRRSPPPSPISPLAVIAMGKFGAGELNVASDLDLLFVYEGEGADALSAAPVSSPNASMRAMREPGWEPDADLRPEGRNGPLARSIAAYLEYWQRYAETWEFQALLRARAMAGDPDLGRRFESNAADSAYPPDGLTIDRVAAHPPHARTDRTGAREAARGGEVPLQARDRLARRRAVRGGALADATRRRAPRDP